MKQPRVKLAAGILTGVAALVAASGWFLWDGSMAMTQETACLQGLLSQNAPREVIESELDSLTARWRSIRFPMMLFLPREEVEDLDDSVARLRPMYEAGCDELTAEMKMLAASFERIRREEFMVL